MSFDTCAAVGPALAFFFGAAPGAAGSDDFFLRFFGAFSLGAGASTVASFAEDDAKKPAYSVGLVRAAVSRVSADSKTSLSSMNESSDS